MKDTVTSSNLPLNMLPLPYALAALRKMCELLFQSLLTQYGETVTRHAEEKNNIW